MHELVCYRNYIEGDPLSFWRTSSGYEVDFILGDHTAVEVKAKRTVGDSDLRSLRALADEERFNRYICVSLESRRRTVGKITIMRFADFMQELWDGAYH